MSEFKRYDKISRWDNTDVQGIENGECYVFPKLDGANASVWLDALGNLRCGSRNQTLNAEVNLAGFHEYTHEQMKRVHTLGDLRLFGEWLVPHTLKTYREDAWRKFYVFDVYDNHLEEWLDYTEYAELLGEMLVETTIQVIHPLCIITNPTKANIIHEMRNNRYLIDDAADGPGEGVVVKNYGFVNRFGKGRHAKLVRQDFKEESARAFGVAEKDGSFENEVFLAEKFVTQARVNKIRNKLELDVGLLCDNRKRGIPRLLETVYHDVVEEEIHNMLKALKGKRSVIDFGRLRSRVLYETKKYAADLF